MDLDYEHKYNKYKKKYLDLKYKEYSGGGFFYFFYSKEKKSAFNAVKINGLELKKYNDFQNDKDVVLEAVKKDGLALQYASENLQNDKKIVLAAVKRDGLAVQYASNVLKDNKEVGLAASLENSTAEMYLSSDLIKSPQFTKELNEKIDKRHEDYKRKMNI